MDYSCTIRNNGENLELLEGGDWEAFTATFDQRQSILSLSYPPPLTFLGHRRSSSMRRRFSAVQSSEDNHKSDDMEFYGPFAEIRQSLDYSYHRNYTFERQRFQDAIIREFLDAAVFRDRNGEICTTPTHPFAVFTAGAMYVVSFLWCCDVLCENTERVFSFSLSICLPIYLTHPLLFVRPGERGRDTRSESLLRKVASR